MSGALSLVCSGWRTKKTRKYQTDNCLERRKMDCWRRGLEYRPCTECSVCPHHFMQERMPSEQHMQEALENRLYRFIRCAASACQCRGINHCTTAHTREEINPVHQKTYAKAPNPIHPSRITTTANGNAPKTPIPMSALRAIQSTIQNIPVPQNNENNGNNKKYL